MKAKRPSKPKPPRRPSRVATPMSVPQDRRHAQMIRTDRTGPTYETLAKRASFWQSVQRAQDAQAQQQADQQQNDPVLPAIPLDQTNPPLPFTG